MGIYSRDYVRDDRRGWSPSGSFGTPGCKWIIIATVAVFILQVITTHSVIVRVTEILALKPDRVLHGEIWRLVTYAFCHATDGQEFVWHLLFNMLFVWWWGPTLERMYGTREFVAFYLTAALAGGLAFLGLAWLQQDATPMVGASGAVMAIMALYAIFFPRDELYLFFLLRVQIRWVVLAYLVIDLVPVLQSFSGEGNRDGVAHVAHLGGLAFGFLYYRFGWKLTNLGRSLPAIFNVRTWSRRTWNRPRHVRVYQPPEEAPQSFDVKVDAILDKIHAQGEASLTEQERDILRKASERYKSNQRHS